jgi:hypothetical protein
MSYLSSDEFANVCYENDFDIPSIQATLRDLGLAETTIRPGKIKQRIANLKRKGVLPLDSGNVVDSSTVLKGTSTLYGSDGSIKQQWVKSDVPKEQFLEAFEDAISDLASGIPTQPEVPAPVEVLDSDLATLYVSNDVHFGALMWDKESGKDWDTNLASQTIKAAYDYLFSCSPKSKVGIVTDLGDLCEVDDFKNMTPKSGNILSVDSRYPKILRAAYEALIYAVNKALEKHEHVYFYNIAGNHDVSTGTAIREVIRVAFKSNPRVTVDDSPMNIKYHTHGTTLLGFAHGDGLKLKDAGEAMAFDQQHVFSQTKHRFFHMGHTHKDAVVDTRLCRAESHRNLAPLNHWAFDHGYRSGAGTMKSITYHTQLGEVSRQIFNVT